MVDLGTLGGAFVMPTGLNSHGQIAGFSNLAGDQTSHAFFWDAGADEGPGHPGRDLLAGKLRSTTGVKSSVRRARQAISHGARFSGSMAS